MFRLIAARLAMLPVVVLGVVTILFIIFHSVPGDEATLAAGATATQAEIENMRHQLGLDRTWLVQYADRVTGLARADLGYSTTFRANPLPRILERVPATVLLAISATAAAVVVGVPTG